MLSIKSAGVGWRKPEPPPDTILQQPRLGDISRVPRSMK
jgi:hypothetical protein